MRRWSKILRDHITRLVLLPLFPQYSLTTTGSCLKYFQNLDRQASGFPPKWTFKVIEAWYDEPLYIESMADLIRESLGRFSEGGSEQIHLLYSAHSIPARYVREGDPYLEQTRQTVTLIQAKLGNAYPSTLAFQSKVGPVDGSALPPRT